MTAPEIISVSARVVISDAGTPVMLSVGPVARREVALITVACADGTTGHGEAFAGGAGAVVATAVSDVLAPLLVGRTPSQTGELPALVRRRHLLSHGVSSAIRLGLSGVDMAMWDSLGKSLQVPVHELLGGGRTTFDVYAGGFALGIQSADELIAEARGLIDAGWVNGCKLRLGTTPSDDLERVRAVRTALGDQTRLMVDANLGQHYDAARVAAGLGELGAEWLEEPCERGRRDRYTALRARSPVPIGGGENLRGAEEFFDWIAAGALDVAQQDASRVGGITEMLRIAAVAPPPACGSCPTSPTARSTTPRPSACCRRSAQWICVKGMLRRSTSSATGSSAAASSGRMVRRGSTDSRDSVSPSTSGPLRN